MGDLREGEQQRFQANKTENQIDVWSYESHFREYAFLLGRRGKDALETIDNYPAKIELDSSWHRALDSMRHETDGDQNERYTVVGFRETSRDFYFPQKTITGEPYTVPVKLVYDMISEAKEKHGVNSILGDVHTHKSVTPLSFPDCYGFLSRSSFHEHNIKGVINPRENIFVFKTRETYAVEDFGIPSYSTLVGFRNYWMRKTGFKESDKPHHLSRVVPTADLWSANIAIAQAHRLVLYEGKPGKDLVRIFP